MRSALFLSIASLVTIFNTNADAQESSFAPDSVSTAIESVATETPSLFDQQAVGAQLDVTGPVQELSTPRETVNLPDITTYTEPSFAGNNDVSFGTRTTANQPQSRGQGIGGYFRQASLDAPTEGITLSLLGGWAYANFVDEFGRDVGEDVVVGDTLGFSVGRRFSSTIRADFELSWRDADISGVAPSGTNYYRYESELKHFSGMVNFYYDYDRVGGRIVTPYVGLGLGASQQRYSFVSDHPFGIDRSSSETRFALQTMAGFSVNVTARNALFFEGRLFSTFENDRSNTFNEAIFGWRHTF